jgi:hypothetical protein
MNAATLQTSAQEDLWAACTNGSSTSARAALDIGAMATQGQTTPLDYVKSPLQMFAYFPSHVGGPALIRLLVERGADPNAYTSNCDRGIYYSSFDVDNDLPLVSVLPKHVHSVASVLASGVKKSWHYVLYINIRSLR